MNFLRGHSTPASPPPVPPHDYGTAPTYPGYDASQQQHAPAQRQAPVTSIDTEHNDMIYDIQLDYYGKRLATCSGDRTFRIYDVSGATAPLSGGPPKDPAAAAPETAHVLRAVVPLPTDSTAPVHRVVWAHPKYGSVLALAAQDGRVYVYREELVQGHGDETEWHVKYVHTFHAQNATSIAWAPYEYGLCLAVASADGQVSFLTRLKEGWVTTSSFVNSQDGAACMAVSWAPYNSLGSQGASGPIQRVVTGSTNTAVTVWQFSPESNAWQIVGVPLYGHNDWVRDVAWAPNVGIPANVVASASDDHTVRIWLQSGDAQSDWSEHVLHTFRSAVYRISWSLTGSVLSVAAGDDEVTFWKQRPDHSWAQLSSVTDQGAKAMA
jgi:protein transport protein SEC13